MTFILKAGLTVAAAVAGATHAIPEAAPAPPAAGEAAGVGGAFGRDVAVVSHDALQVAHALVELHRNQQTQFTPNIPDCSGRLGDEDQDKSNIVINLKHILTVI